MAVAIVTGRIPPKPTQKNKLHIEACPFCGSLDIYMWDNEEEVKEARTKPLAEDEIRYLLDYRAGIICNSCGANVEFDYGTPDYPLEPCDAAEAREWLADSWNQRDTGISFFEFMMKYLKKDSPAGDLARDMDRDKGDFTHKNTRNEIMSYLRSKGACQDCLNTFLKCYKRYEQYKQRQHKEKSNE